MMKLMILALSVWTSVSTISHAAKIENIEFPESMLVGSHKYELNGTALRKKRKLGMNFKVYVAALYVAAKTADAEALINSTQPKILDLVFLREVDRETLQEAWSEAFKKNCGKDCEAAQAQFKAFNDLMADVMEQSRIRIAFERESVNVEVKGRAKTNAAMLAGEEIRRALLAIFIGPKPPSAEFKKGLGF